MRKVFLMYFAGWGIYNRERYLSDITSSEITHICYAFGLIDPSNQVKYWVPEALTSYKHDFDKNFYRKGTELFTGGARTEILTYKANKPVHFGLSMGGATLSDNIATTLANPTARKTFIDSLVKKLIEDNFDFVDMDWEFPGANDNDNYIAFLKELQAAMTADGKNRYITAAFSAGVSNLMPLKLKEIFDLLAFGNIMTYCMSCGRKDKATHDAPWNEVAELDSIGGTVKYIKSVGVPPEKIIIGFAAYGQGFPNCSGIGQPFSGEAQFKAKYEADHYDFEELAKIKDQLEEGYDEKAVAGFSIAKAYNLTISHDTKKSVAEKMRLAFAEGCGGAFVWFSAQDSKTSDFNLSSWVNAAIMDGIKTGNAALGELPAKYFAVGEASPGSPALPASPAAAATASGSQAASSNAAAAAGGTKTASGSADSQASSKTAASNVPGAASSGRASNDSDMQKCLKVCKCITENL